jgi:hypothetical protein
MAMSTRQQIISHINTFADVESLRSVVCEWLNQVEDGDKSLQSLELAWANRCAEFDALAESTVALSEIDRRQQQQLYPYDETARLEDEQAYQECLTGSVADEAVVAWITSLGTAQE